MKALALLLGLVALGGGKPSVFAAASLTEVLPRIQPAARYQFAGSDQLAYQIQQGAPADLFLAAVLGPSEHDDRAGATARSCTPPATWRAG